MIVGCGDIGLRVAKALGGRVNVLALSSSPARVAGLRQHGIRPLCGDLDQPASLARLAGLASRVLHLAPPAASVAPPFAAPALPARDRRSQALLRALRRRSLPGALVYASTSGVYGDCGGAWVDECRCLNAGTPRAQRRVDAEAWVRHFGRSSAGRSRASILRIPGIYAPDREGGTPRARLLTRTPVLLAQDDVYTSHIHADDLARACVHALWRGKPQRVYNICDDTQLKMGDYFDLAADLYQLARPPRISRSAAQTALAPSLLSFMGESRRLDNQRMKVELRLVLGYPTVAVGLL